MRKLAVIIAAAVLAMALAGCASSGSGSASAASSAASDSSASASAASESSASAESSASVGMANPWSEAIDANAAAEGAGLVKFVVPATVEIDNIVFENPTFKYMENIAQADYANGNATFTIRKGQGVTGTEFTGDYNQYAKTWTQDIEGKEVLCYGNQDGVANLATWEAFDCSYALYCNDAADGSVGIPDAVIASVVAQIA